MKVERLDDLQVDRQDSAYSASAFYTYTGMLSGMQHYARIVWFSEKKH